MILGEIHLTTRCNSKCLLCNRRIHPSSNKNMDFEIFKSIPDIFSCYTISNHNGEHTLHPNFMDIIKIIRGRNRCIYLNSNASTHDEKWWFELGKIMKSKDCKAIFSIDGLKESHEYYRVGTSWDKTVKNIEAFNKGGGISYCNTIIFRHNENEIDEIRKISKNIGCAQHRIKISWDYNKECERPLTLDIDTREETSIQNKDKKMKCRYLNFDGEKSYSLSVDGEYFPCCYIIQDIEYKRDDIICKKYEESKGQLNDIYKAVNSPLHKYVSENIENIKICNLKCRNVSCEDQFIHKNQVKKKKIKQDIIDIYEDLKIENSKVSLCDLVKVVKNYPHFNIIRYKKMWNNLFDDVIKTLSLSENDILDAFGYSQYMSKNWLLDKSPDMSNKRILILGSWIGLLARMIFDKYECSIVTVDSDKSISKESNFLNRNYKSYQHLTFEAIDIDYDSYDIIINTSCEHMKNDWYEKVQNNQLLILQSTNNIFFEDHKFTSKNLKEFENKYKMNKILYSDEKSNIWNSKLKRFMIIGYKNEI